MPGHPPKPHRSFDPRRVGTLECDAWVAYYRREWLKFLRSAILLTRHTFGLPWARTAHGAWLVLRANQQSACSLQISVPALPLTKLLLKMATSLQVTALGRS